MQVMQKLAPSSPQPTVQGSLPLPCNLMCLHSILLQDLLLVFICEKTAYSQTHHSGCRWAVWEDAAPALSSLLAPSLSPPHPFSLPHFCTCFPPKWSRRDPWIKRAPLQLELFVFWGDQACGCAGRWKGPARSSKSRWRGDLPGRRQNSPVPQIQQLCLQFSSYLASAHLLLVLCFCQCYRCEVIVGRHGIPSICCERTAAWLM